MSPERFTICHTATKTTTTTKTATLYVRVRRYVLCMFRCTLDTTCVCVRNVSDATAVSRCKADRWNANDTEAAVRVNLSACIVHTDNVVAAAQQCSAR